MVGILRRKKKLDRDSTREEIKELIVPIEKDLIYKDVISAFEIVRNVLASGTIENMYNDSFDDKDISNMVAYLAGINASTMNIKSHVFDPIGFYQRPILKAAKGDYLKED